MMRKDNLTDLVERVPQQQAPTPQPQSAPTPQQGQIISQQGEIVTLGNESGQNKQIR